MRIAVTIPTFNRSELLKEALRSVLRCPGSERVDLHVFDNASTDDTLAMLRLPEFAPVTVHTAERNSGYVGNLNRCLSLADRYDWVAVLHSDDLYAKHAIKHLMAAIRAHPEAGLIYSAVDCIDNTGRVIKSATPRGRIFAAGREAVMRAQRQIPCSSSAYSAPAIAAAGLFSPEFPFSADEEYNCRIGARFAIVECEAVIACYREHDAHMMYKTWQSPDFLSNFERMRLKMNGYLPQPLAESLVRRQVALTLAQECSTLVALGDSASARRYARNLWARAPLAALKPRLALKTAMAYLPAALGGRLAQLLSRKYQ